MDLCHFFFEKIKYNEIPYKKSYEKINIKLTNENDVQLFRKSIFINETKGKNDVFVVLDKFEKDVDKKKKLQIKKMKV